MTIEQAEKRLEKNNEKIDVILSRQDNDKKELLELFSECKKLKDFLLIKKNAESVEKLVENIDIPSTRV